MEEQLRAKIEEILTEFPIFQYGFLKTDQITFKEEVRCICRQECERYGTSWSCPRGGDCGGVPPKMSPILSCAGVHHLGGGGGRR